MKDIESPTPPLAAELRVKPTSTASDGSGQESLPPLTQSREATSRPLLLKKQLILLALLLAARGISGYAASGEPPKPAKAVSLKLPASFGGWQGQDVEVSPFVYQELHPDAVLQKRYTFAPETAQQAPVGTTLKARQDSSPQVEVLVMYSHDTYGFHPPEVCLKMEGWAITDQKQRELRGRGQILNLSVITAQQKGAHRLLAYSFSDTSGAVSGRTEAFTRMILARASRQSAGTLELQFAYDGLSLLPDGDFTPAFKDFMLQVTASVRRQLAQSTTS